MYTIFAFLQHEYSCIVLSTNFLISRLDFSLCFNLQVIALLLLYGQMLLVESYFQASLIAFEICEVTIGFTFTSACASFQTYLMPWFFVQPPSIAQALSDCSGFALHCPKVI